MILKGINFDSVFKDEKRQERIKSYGNYYLDLKLEPDGRVFIYDNGEVVDSIPSTYNFEGLFDRRNEFKLILKSEGYYVVRYVDIHAHSAYSILDGMTTLDEMIEDIEWCGALTDHGNMFGFYKFNNKMIAKGKKPILGFEAYIQRKYQPQNSKRMARGHLLILIKNEAGYRNAIKLSTLGYVKGEKTKKLIRPAITYEDLKKHSEGLIVTSACLGGDIPKFIQQGQEDIAFEIAKEMKDIFGDDFYIEIQRHKMEDEVKINSKLIKIARELDIKVVAGLDSHYLRKEDSYYQEILLANNRKTTMSDPNRWVFEGEGYHRLTSDEMVELFSDIPEALDNTLEIADKIEFVLQHNGYHLPKFDVPDEFKVYPEPKDDKEMDANQYEYMYHLCREGMKRLGFDGLNEYEERLDFELEVIKRMGYSAYFLIVWDFIDYAKRNGILVGPGRGSACGSLVAYTLSITDVDPIRYGLLFERFLSPDRVSMPDIDVDFQDDRREEVIEYVREKYGAECVSYIITYGQMKAKSAIRDVARILDYPVAFGDKIAKLIPDTAKNLKQALKESIEFSDLYDADENVRKIVDVAIRIEGLPKSTGKHACFSYDTLVATDKGKKMIIDVKVGDMVLTHNNRYKPVMELYRTQTDLVYSIEFESGNIIEVTGNHPLYVKDSRYKVPVWKKVESIDIKKDKVALLKDNSEIEWVKVKEVKGTNKFSEMFNLSVLDDNSYVANDIVAHNCGIIIAPDEITNFIPQIIVADETGEKDEKGNKIFEHVMVTQINMVECEEMGLLKMDFLGLRNLSVISGALKLINKNREKEGLAPLKMDDIPITDPYAYRHIQAGNTVGVFQLESPGMTDLVSKTYLDIEEFIKKYDANPEVDEKGVGVFSEEFDALFERLIALISLYRPGPMDEIPNYLKNMANPEDIEYDVPEMEDLLSNTYGIIVYQEQVMHTVRKLAGFSAGESDVIRKAMGKFLPHLLVIVRG